MLRSRRLAAIMFTDIQGYTALMQQNEERAIRTRDKHRRIFNAVTEKYQGKVLQYYGDGTLSIFDSAIDAVQCGIEMQRGFREAPSIPVRIGIHTGDIIFSEEDIIGDSVNVASRIESLAVPGSVFISDKVYDEIKNQESIKAALVKQVKLKNVKKPVEVYAIANIGLVVPNPEDINGKTDPPSVSSTEPRTPPASGHQENASRPPVLATKLYLPPPRPKMVDRSRLAERLDKGLPGKLTLISAPAGFGKSTLVSKWVADMERPVAWLSLDEGDHDPNRFMVYLVAALQTIAPEVGKSVLDRLQSPQPPPVESVLTALLNDIAAIPGEFVLVLDDYHAVDSKPVDEALAFLLEYLPPQMHLIIATREDPNLPLARLRARGQLSELRAADLRFTPSEAAGFLNRVMGLDLQEEDIAALESRTEGWIAGLQLAALSIQGRPDAGGFIRAFTGSHRFILDYLAEEVLQRQPAKVRSFLLQTALLNRLCGALCNAVTGREDGKEMLEALERGNLFIVPLDDQRHWFRYHHLFADVLLARSTEERPAQLSDLHRRASRWFEGEGLWGEAVHHAMAAKNEGRVADLSELAWPEMDGSFESPTWLGWVKDLPEEIIRARPVLSVAYAWALLSSGELEAGAVRLQNAERWLDASPERRTGMIVVDEEQFRFLLPSIATARAYLAQSVEDISRTVSYARQALDLLPEEDHLRRGPAASLLGLSYWAEGKLEAAHQTLSEAMDNFRRAGNLHFAISGTYGLADIRIAQGRLGAAVDTYQRSLQQVTAYGEPLRGTADLYLGLGDLFRERGDLDKADQYLQRSEKLGEAAALQDWRHRWCSARSRLMEARGDLDVALDLLNEAENHYYRTPVPDVRPIPALRARIWIRQGRLTEVTAWVREKNISAVDELHYLREFEHITLARFLIARYKKAEKDRDIQDAAGLLARLLKAAEKAGRIGSVIEILLLQALAIQSQGESSSAIPPLKRSLELAQPEGYVRVFADEGAGLAPLLTEAAVRGVVPAYTKILLSAISPESEEKSLTPITASDQPLIEPLSQRELEVLRLIADGLSNREIGERLFLALSTVKGHNQNIFGKLGVQRRTEAVARARKLRLL